MEAQRLCCLGNSGKETGRCQTQREIKCNPPCFRHATALLIVVFGTRLPRVCTTSYTGVSKVRKANISLHGGKPRCITANTRAESIHGICALFCCAVLNKTTKPRLSQLSSDSLCIPQKVTFFFHSAQNYRGFHSRSTEPKFHLRKRDVTRPLLAKHAIISYASPVVPCIIKTQMTSYLMCSFHAWCERHSPVLTTPQTLTV